MGEALQKSTSTILRIQPWIVQQKVSRFFDMRNGSNGGRVNLAIWVLRERKHAHRVAWSWGT